MVRKLDLCINIGQNYVYSLLLIEEHRAAKRQNYMHPK